MRAKEFILESVDPYTIFNQVKDIHREFQDIEEGDLPDRIYWFDDYQLTELPLSKINLDEFYIDEDLIEEYIEHIKDSPNTMPPIVYDPIAGSVIDGMHRANAYARLGRKSIPAYVGKTKSDSYGTRESDYDEEEIDEMALPADWDPAALGHDKSFKSRLQYALERAPRLGGGSSRVAFVIPDNGRETVLKVAKNNKGVAQNEAEVDVLDDGYLGKLDIVIPLVDYDKENPQPTWIQTEKANKISQRKLEKMLHAGGRWPMTNFLYAVDNLLGKKEKYMPTLDQIKKDMIDTGSNEQDIDIFFDYVNQVADLVNSSNLLPGDFGRAANWGEFQGRPVIIDLGYTKSVHELYWGR